MVPALGDTDLKRGDGRRGPIVLNRRAATRPTVTGVERWAAELIPRLKAMAPDLYVVAEPPGGGATGRGRGQAWEQLTLPITARRLGASLILSPANLAPMFWPRNVLVLHDAAVLREPTAYSRSYQLWHRHWGLACARRALAVITVSEFSRRELIELAGIDPRRLVVVRPGIGEHFRPDADHQRVAAKLGLSRPYVLTLATDDRRKNLGALALAAARLDALGIDLVRGGDTRPYLARQQAPAGIRSVGYVDEDDLAGLYAGARAFVLPSRYEGLGLPCLEAMACGVPVVAARRAALPETCADAALLANPDDAHSLADAVVRSATDAELRAQLQIAGSRRAAAFTWDQTARDVHELMSSLAGG
jgi:glycosyltransferase involved in cell wall biosynthesis